MRGAKKPSIRENFALTDLIRDAPEIQRVHRPLIFKIPSAAIRKCVIGAAIFRCVVDFYPPGAVPASFDLINLVSGPFEYIHVKIVTQSLLLPEDDRFRWEPNRIFRHPFPDKEIHVGNFRPVIVPSIENVAAESRVGIFAVRRGNLLPRL